MAMLTRDQLKTYFETGDTPTQSEFFDLLESIPIFQSDSNYYGKETTITAFNGGGQANAYELTRCISIITTCTNPNDSVKFNNNGLVKVYYIYNKTANASDIYPSVGGEINNLGVNNPISIPAGQIFAFACYGAGSWMKIT